MPYRLPLPLVLPAVLLAAPTALLAAEVRAPMPAAGLHVDAPRGVGGCAVPLRSRVAADSTLEARYAAGRPWPEFLEAVRARRELWLANAARPLAPADAVARARALPGRWRLLVIAVDSCSDSVNTIPFIAQLVAAAPQLEMRIISPAEGRALMEARRTPDGRAATPTVIVLDAAGQEAGCWIERPAALQALAIEARAGGGTPAFAERKASWYAADAGASTVREVVAVLEKAAAGARGCDAPGGPVGQ